MDRHAPYGRRNGSLLDLGLAGFAACSAGFAAFAMPEHLFSGLVAATGLPSVLSAAQPPLGATARLAFVAAVTLVTFGFVWSLMRALDRRPAAAAVGADELAAAELPRMRRADAHPDAPVRRPLLARQDLAEPEDAAFEEVAAPAPAAELPAFLPATDSEPELETGGFGKRRAPTPEPEPAPVEELLEPSADIEFPLELTETADELPEPVVAAAPAIEPTPAPETATAAPAEEDSLTALMQRLDKGLVRKRQALESPGPQAAEQAPEPAPEPVRNRLRSAIRDLEQISARGA
jgi:hypothetical protein